MRYALKDCKLANNFMGVNLLAQNTLQCLSPLLNIVDSQILSYD